MSRCEECVSRIDLYLDDELGEDDLTIFERHLAECPSCRNTVAERRQFLEQIRSARPLHVPSSEFRAKVAALMVAEAPAYPDRTSFVGPAKTRDVRRPPRSWFTWFGSTLKPAYVFACLLVIVGTVVLWRLSSREMRSNAFVEMALEVHRQQLAGRLPLELLTSSPTDMSTWFAGKVPFHFRLPDYQEAPGRDPKYKLSGGSLITFRGDSAAYIAYRMKSQLISLVIVSTSSSVASGGERMVARGLSFHAHRKGDLEVITWSVHNLTYALVSAVNLPAGQSCIVCHGSEKEGDLIQGLRARRKSARSNQTAMLLSDADTRRLQAIQ
jgi:anti-sigma factor RsiW